MSEPGLKSRLKQRLEQALAKLAPLTHIVPVQMRHAARDRILRAAGISHGREPRGLPALYKPGLVPPGVNLFGFFRAENGLAQGVKCYARAVEAAGEGAARVSLVLKADIRPGHEGQLAAKVERVEQHLARNDG